VTQVQLKVVPFFFGIPRGASKIALGIGLAVKIINGRAHDFFLAISVSLNGTGTVGDFLSTLYWYMGTTI
jgi:hypothetical protein